MSATRRAAFIDRVDPATGRRVRQLDTSGSFQHLYLTSSSFSADGRRLMLIGDDGDGSPNLHELEVESGALTRLTDNRDGVQRTYMYVDGRPRVGFAKPTPAYCQATDQLLYVQGRDVRLVDVASRAERTIHRLPDDASPAYAHLGTDGRLACVPYVPVSLVDRGPDDDWFTNTGDAVREGPGTEVVVIATDGSGVVDRFRVQAWVTHVQFRPGDDATIMFNHEGPGIGQQRMWVRSAGRVAKLRASSSEPDEARYWACHEAWKPDGTGLVYHGGRVIDGVERAFAGLVDIRSGEHRELLLPGPDRARWRCHMTSNRDGSVLVTDGTPDAPNAISLVHADWERGTLRLEALCAHDTRWGDGEGLYQDTHPHPVLSPDGGWAVFTSDARNDRFRGHVYLVETGLA